MDDKVFQAALAGLLHDVGKFGQRAGELGSRTWDKEAEQGWNRQEARRSIKTELAGLFDLTSFGKLE